MQVAAPRTARAGRANKLAGNAHALARRWECAAAAQAMDAHKESPKSVRESIREPLGRFHFFSETPIRCLFLAQPSRFRRATRQSDTLIRRIGRLALLFCSLPALLCNVGPLPCRRTTPLRSRARLRRAALRPRRCAACGGAPQDGCTSLHLVAKNGHLKVARLLLQQSANKDAQDSVRARSAARYGPAQPSLMRDATAAASRACSQALLRCTSAPRAVTWSLRACCWNVALA